MVSKVQVAIKPEEKKIDEKIKEETEESRAEIEKESFGSFTQRLFSAILLVILGVIVGVTLYHFILRNLLIPSKPKEILLPPVVVSQDIEYTSFEDNRRNVDANPEKYIQVSGAKAETTEDFYLLGRAYFLLGNYVEAKKAFSKAKELVAEAKEINRKTLENEIAWGLSTVENVIARNEFITQKKSMEVKEKPNTNLLPNANIGTGTSANSERNTPELKNNNATNSLSRPF